MLHRGGNAYYGGRRPELEFFVSKEVFLHYTQEELNRNFDQRGWAKNALEVIARYGILSKKTRETLEVLSDLSYGPHPDERLDIFPAARPGAPTQIFVHGGAWKNFAKDDYSFPALAFVPAGINTVILNFSKLPTEWLPTIVRQVGRGIEWVYAHIKEFGGDPSKIYLSAQLSGAHLSATAIQQGGYDFIREQPWSAGRIFRTCHAQPSLRLRQTRRARGEGVQPRDTIRTK